jgi:Family of unknown function (DUF6499)
MFGDQTRRLDDFDFADFAQEFLRRNPLYRRQYQMIAVDDGLKVTSKDCIAMAHSWGLTFPLSA